MDEFTPGNNDRERRGRVAFERMRAVSIIPVDPWSDLPESVRVDWCHIAEAAFEEGRLFERERDGVAVRLQPGERLISYVYRTASGSKVAIEVTTA